MTSDLDQIGLRIKGLREACDVSVSEMANELGLTDEAYVEYETTGADIPISVIYHIAHKFGVDLTEIITGVRAKLDTYQVVKKGAGMSVDRYPGYAFQDLAWRYAGKIMQPLLVTIDPHKEPAELVTHSGQEFNMVLQGTMTFSFGDKEITLEAGDSVYFNPEYTHGQSCAGDEPVVFLTVISE